jgi:hypothetical protein
MQLLPFSVPGFDSPIVNLLILVAVVALLAGASSSRQRPSYRSRRRTLPRTNATTRPGTLSSSFESEGSRRGAQRDCSWPSQVSIQPETSYSGPIVIQGSSHLSEGPFSHMESFQQGLEGEEHVVGCLLHTLNAQWYIFRNVVVPGNKGDIDLVLVGPGGVVAVEVKSYWGNVRVENGRWYVETSTGYDYRRSRGANAQVRTNAAALYGYLRERGMNKSCYVRRLVVLASEAELNVASSGTDVVHISDLGHWVRRLTTQTRLRQWQVNDIALMLKYPQTESALPVAQRLH